MNLIWLCTVAVLLGSTTGGEICQDEGNSQTNHEIALQFLEVANELLFEYYKAMDQAINRWEVFNHTVDALEIIRSSYLQTSGELIGEIVTSMVILNIIIHITFFSIIFNLKTRVVVDFIQSIHIQQGETISLVKIALRKQKVL